MKRNKTFRKWKRHLMSFFTFNEGIDYLKSGKDYKRWENGWKRHCSSRGMIRRIGNRQNAIKLGLIKA